MAPAELALLPDPWLAALVGMMGNWEDGHRPEALRQVLFSITPKPKTESEAVLRPIGLLPYVYRV